jgi:5-methylcytosine-specific restriction protein B
MNDEPHLDLQKTYAAILKAARGRRFISYGDLAAANGVPWARARYVLPQLLGQLVTIAYEQGWPFPSAIVVNKDDVETGNLQGSAREGFLSAARSVGIEVDDPDAFVKDQQRKLFDWAPTAPDTLVLDVADIPAPKAGGPRFVQYFAPVLDALRDLGGEAKPKDVYAWIIKKLPVPESETGAVTKGGQPKFENKVGWARFYLAKAGLIDDRRRGIWVLTPEGRAANLDHAQALALFKEVHARFPREDAEEEEPPPPASVAAELFDDPSRQFWFAGAAWGEGDQTERFVREGIWQNGYDEKFTDDVRRIKPGDRIAIKSSFVRRHNLPFSAAGKAVSAMRIKAIGTVTENLGDGKTVRVTWEPVSPPRDWYFYTYRTTLNEADPNDQLARQLILFAFGNAPQDYPFWLNQPYFAGKYGKGTGEATLEPFFEDDEEEEELSEDIAPPSYTLENIIEDGCFLPLPTVGTILQRLSDKKNVILQGPPGTGKTWLARRLGYALIGTRDRKAIQKRLRVVQFHPSLSYEDFVRGWRPERGGGLALIDGIFLETVQAAAAEPDRAYVLVVEEINRGNPAQVFGEMLTLLEDSKRRPDEALELAYRRADGERVYIPPNLHVIGTMNIADRSLALVDLALRRRFAFITLEPALNEAWRAWCTKRCGVDAAFLSLVETRIAALNNEIAEDRSLGTQYRIGHSYVTPPDGAAIADHKAWFRNVIETEIRPLLEEYWFDAPEKAQQAAARLLADLS